MPTISQLPRADEVSAANLLPISQDGSAYAISVGSLLAGSQPAIAISSPSLLGRISLGPGGPEEISIGSGLVLNNATLSAETLDTSRIPVQTGPVPSDWLVGERNGELQRVEFGKIKDLFSAGPNISIDAAGVISGTTVSGDLSAHFSTLPPTISMANDDLIGVSHGGQDRVVSYANFIDGIAIAEARIADPTADTDTFWTGQSDDIMARQTFGEVWRWIVAKLPMFRRQSVELHGNTEINGGLHNNTFLVCSAPVVLDGTPAGLGLGFRCEVINASSGIVLFSSNLQVHGGIAAVLPGQCRAIQCVSVNGNLTVFASASSGGGATAAPGVVSSLSAQEQTSHSITLIWEAPTTGGTPEGYVIQYRTTGEATWRYLYQPTGTLVSVVDGLLSATSHDFMVVAANAAGPGPGSNVLHTATMAAIGAPGAPTALSIGNLTTSGLLLSWVAPVSGGPGLTYTVFQRLSGQTSWNIAAGSVSTTSFQIADLAPDTLYDFQVASANSSGTSAPSPVVSGRTAVAPGQVTSITWNLVPSGTYAHGTGAIGVNAHVTPAGAQIRFGFSTSSTAPPSSWTTAVNVNTDLWGAYVPTPPTIDNWYVWATGVDGSAPTVYQSSFVVT